jgi:hypothetical protein
MNDKIVISGSNYLGAVKLKSEWQVFHAVLYMWILDYAAYNPSYDPATSKYHWRQNLLRVSESNASEYCRAMTVIPMGDVTNVIQEIQQRDGEIKYFQPPLTFVVNFDECLFINGWWELIIPFHKLIPDSWKGLEDSPYKYVPDHLRKLWGEN